MRILFVTTAHNSLSQRLLVELTQRGHRVSVCIATSGDDMLPAARAYRPDLIVAPMLKTAIPEVLWRRYLCLIVHPGIEPAQLERVAVVAHISVARDEQAEAALVRSLIVRERGCEVLPAALAVRDELT